MLQAGPIANDLVLLGGGHSHALALRMLGMRRAFQTYGIRATLVSDVTRAPYSGMVPGRIAGVYTDDEIHIDLPRLCEFAGANFVHAAVTGLDLGRRRVLLGDHPDIGFDVLSLNTGGTPAAAGVPGADRYATPAKPVSRLLAAWDAVASGDVVVVGAGPGGVELALAMAARLGARIRLRVIDGAAVPLPTLAPAARERLLDALARRSVTGTFGSAVTRVEAGRLHLASGESVPFDHLFWVTGVTPAPWLRDSGLSLDAAGHVLVDDYLASRSHDFVFAAGDVAAPPGAVLPRSGVYAVRQADPLAANLLHALAGAAASTRRPYRPQRRVLSLIGLGAADAVAVRGGVVSGGPLVWRLKQRIDRRFMDRFASLAPMTPEPADPLAARAAARCGGCAAKVGGDVLAQTLGRLQVAAAPDVLVGLRDHEDAAVLRPPPGQVLVQSVDYLPRVVSDPFVFGRIAAAHALSDLVAMGASVHSAQVTLNIPYALPAKVEEVAYQILTGVLRTLDACGAVLLGGHTAEGAELGIGLTVNGFAAEDALLKKNGLKPGDALILTKPLGTATILAAHMRLAAPAASLEDAIQSMLRTNVDALAGLRRYGVTACTDVTGFGLAGHLTEMARASGVRCVLDWRRIPLLQGAAALARAGFESTLYASNVRAAPVAGATPASKLLHDPQTSGGLLAAVPAARAAACAAELGAAVIGEVVPRSEGDPWVAVR